MRTKYLNGFELWLESTKALQVIVDDLKATYPGLDLFAWESDHKIEIAMIAVPNEQRGQGIGSAVVRSIQDYAAAVKKPIVLIPSANSRKKSSLDKFYKQHGFVKNKGRNKDYLLSKTFATTMYWRPE